MVKGKPDLLLNNLLKNSSQKDCCYYIGDTLVDLNFFKKL